VSVDPLSVPVRYSNLKHLAKSPAHYLHAINCPREDSGPLRIGRLVHWHLLGAMPDDEDGEIHIYDGERRGKPWEAFAELHAGSEIVTRKEWERALPIADAVRRNRDAMKLIDGALCEQPIKWSIAGRACSSRPDAFFRGGPLTDLKTTNDASIAGFQRMIFRMAYQAQAAMYRDALASVDIETRGSFIVAVETKAPYPVTVFSLTDAMLDHGRRMYRGWLETLRNCEQSNQWPEYAQTVVTCDVPEWFEGDNDDEGEEVEAA
jgi:hypothetical protein